MRYVLLVYGADGPTRSEEKLPGPNEVYVALAPASSATSIRVRGGDTLVTDGPFDETTETLGGYYVVDADSLDEAIERAARIPAARDGTVEIRPVHDHSEHRA
jgi:hypothetical protein